MEEIKDVNDLRKVLARGIVKVEQDKMEPKRAKAIAELAGKILSSVKLELEYAKMAGVTPQVAFIPGDSKKQIAAGKKR